MSFKMDDWLESSKTGWHFMPSKMEVKMDDLIQNWMIFYTIQKWMTTMIQNWMFFFCSSYIATNELKSSKMIIASHKKIWMITDGYKSSFMELDYTRVCKPCNTKHANVSLFSQSCWWFCMYSDWMSSLIVASFGLELYLSSQANSQLSIT